MIIDEAETLVSKLLRGEPAPWPRNAPAGLALQMRERSVYHGVRTLLHERLSDSDGWPQELREEFRRDAIGRTMWELRHQNVMSRALDALADSGIRAVLIKGTAVAYSHYDNPAARTRGDTDLIIPAARQEEAARALADVGFRCDGPITNDAVSIHSRHVWQNQDGNEHELEVHSRISLSQVVSRLLPYEEIAANAKPVPRLGPSALGHDPVDALLITCYHRTTHKHIPYYADGKAYFGGNRLIWLHDIHLLACSYTSDDWQAVVEQARRRSFCTITWEGLSLARVCFGTRIPDFVQEGLATTDVPEPAARYVQASPIVQQCLDVLEIEGFGAKLAYLKDAALPPAHYMQEKYPTARFRWLPWLHLRRAVDAMRKIMAKRLNQSQML